VDSQYIELANRIGLGQSKTIPRLFQIIADPTEARLLLALPGNAPGLAEKLGLDPDRFFEIANQSSGQCWSLTSYCPWPGPVASAPSNRGYEGGFLTALMSKDLKLAQEAASRSGASTPLGAQAQALYALFEGLGYGQKDFSAVLQLFRGQLSEL